MTRRKNSAVLGRWDFFNLVWFLNKCFVVLQSCPLATEKI